MNKFIDYIGFIFVMTGMGALFYYFWWILLPIIGVVTFSIMGILYYKYRAIEKIEREKDAVS